MINEDFCSYEVAKLLKEKGFDEQTRLAYTESGKADFSSLTRYWNQGSLYACPTHQMAMKWLREVHNIHISIYIFNRELPITNVPIYTCDIATEKLSSQQGHLRGIWKSYEEAVKAALKYSLENLI